jgi:hypothetical protein
MWSLESGTSKDAKSEVAKALAVISRPLADYWHGLSRFNRLEDLVVFIKSQQLISGDLLKYVLGSILVTTVIARVIGYDEGSLEFVDIPILNEILAVGVFLIGGLTAALIYHKPLQLAGGRGTFRHALISAIYVAVTFLPFIVLADGLLGRLADRPLPTAAYSAPQLVYLANLLGKIHELSYQKVFALLSGVTVALIFLGASLMILFL